MLVWLVQGSSEFNSSTIIFVLWEKLNDWNNWTSSVNEFILMNMNDWTTPPQWTRSPITPDRRILFPSPFHLPLFSWTPSSPSPAGPSPIPNRRILFPSPFFNRFWFRKLHFTQPSILHIPPFFQVWIGLSKNWPNFFIIFISKISTNARKFYCIPEYVTVFTSAIHSLLCHQNV